MQGSVVATAVDAAEYRTCHRSLRKLSVADANARCAVGCGSLISWRSAQIEETLRKASWAQPQCLPAMRRSLAAILVHKCEEDRANLISEVKWMTACCAANCFLLPDSLALRLFRRRYDLQKWAMSVVLSMGRTTSVCAEPEGQNLVQGCGNDSIKADGPSASSSTTIS